MSADKQFNIKDDLATAQLAAKNKNREIIPVKVKARRKEFICTSNRPQCI